jgi:hypothetical protein
MKESKESKESKTTELEEKIQRYHTTLLQERDVKNKLVNKLLRIQNLVEGRNRSQSKRGGIPFYAAFMSRNTTSMRSTEIIDKIRKILNS